MNRSFARKVKFPIVIEAVHVTADAFTILWVISAITSHWVRK